MTSLLYKYSSSLLVCIYIWCHQNNRYNSHPSPPSLPSLLSPSSLPTSLPPSPPLPSLPPSLPLVTQRIHCPFQPKQSPSQYDIKIKYNYIFIDDARCPCGRQWLALSWASGHSLLNVMVPINQAVWHGLWDKISLTMFLIINTTGWWRRWYFV